MKSIFVCLALLFSISTPQSAFAKSSPGVAGSLSLVPGLGQVSNGNYVEGLAWAGTTIGLFVSKSPILAHMGLDLWMYNMYDAYRDAGAAGAAKNSVVENYLANFNPLNIIDPYSVGFVGVAMMTNGKSKGGSSQPRQFILRPLSMGFIGLGEEGLFRGFLYPQWSQSFSSKTTGAIVSSLVFAAAHGVGDTSQLSAGPMLVRTIAGLLFCLQYERNKGDLRKNIFAHSWYDILLGRKDSSGTTVMIAKAGFQFQF